MYLPKTKYKSGLFSTNGELVLEKKGTSYTGPYFETFNGDKYVGISPEFSTGEKLVAPKEAPIRSEVLTNEVYDSVRSSRTEFDLRLTEKVPSYYPTPSDVDYEKGDFVRYFVQDKTTTQILEVNKSVYTSILKKETKYYYPKYNQVSISWSLESKRANEVIVTIAEKTLPGISMYLKDPLQFVK